MPIKLDNFDTTAVRNKSDETSNRRGAFIAACIGQLNLLDNPDLAGRRWWKALDDGSYAVIPRYGSVSLMEAGEAFHIATDAELRTLLNTLREQAAAGVFDEDLIAAGREIGKRFTQQQKKAA